MTIKANAGAEHAYITEARREAEDRDYARAERMCQTCGLPRRSCEPVVFWPECMVGLVGRNPHRCSDGFIGHIWDGLSRGSETHCVICGVEWSRARSFSWQLPAGGESKPAQGERPAGVYR